MTEGRSYEEIYGAVLGILAEKPNSRTVVEYKHLEHALRSVASKRGWHLDKTRGDGVLRPRWHDRRTLTDVFWDLFRQGIITLGHPNPNDNQSGFPYFHVSEFGRQLLAQPDAHYFHDVFAYCENVVKPLIPNFDEATMLYLKEALMAFKAQCLLSAAVMLGVAMEHEVKMLMETIEISTYKRTFSRALKERKLYRRLDLFRKAMESTKPSIPKEIDEDFDSRFSTIISVIRQVRNESGHPTGKQVTRQQVFCNLYLFPHCCQKIYQLREFFSRPDTL